MSPDDVDVWVVAIDVDRHELGTLARLLTAAERARGEAFRHSGRRSAFVASRAALRSILGRYTASEPSRIRLGADAGGKPRIEEGGDLRFNLSHSAALAVCAVTYGREVGVDVEWIRPDFDFTRIVDRFFTAGERAALRRLPPASRREAFFRSWTRKEAYLKARGESVFGSPRVEVTVGPDLPPGLVAIEGRPGEPGRFTVGDLTPAAGYVGTVIAAGQGLCFRQRTWSAPARTPSARRSRNDS